MLVAARMEMEQSAQAIVVIPMAQHAAVMTSEQMIAHY